MNEVDGASVRWPSKPNDAFDPVSLSHVERSAHAVSTDKWNVDIVVFIVGIDRVILICLLVDDRASPLKTALEFGIVSPPNIRCYKHGRQRPHRRSVKFRHRKAHI